MSANQHNETLAAAAFTKQSVIFDALYGQDRIIQYKRQRVHDHVLRHLSPASSILELNAGTGEDAIFFAGLGHNVHATDISVGMQNKLAAKTAALHLQHAVSHEVCSYTSLESLKNKGPFDCIFSNFAGLNCTGDLPRVLNSFDSLLRSGGTATLVILPGFCLWETLLIFKGKFRTSFRRFFSKNGRKANIDGKAFTCWYYSPRFIINILREKFEVLGVEGLCTIVPPSYIEHFAEKHPSLFSSLCKLENQLKNKWPFNSIGDYYIISFRKKA